MPTPNDDLIRSRVKGPALPTVKLTSSPDALPSQPLRVKGPPLPTVVLRGEPCAAASVHLRRPLADGTDAEAVKERMLALAGKVNEMEVIEGRAGIRFDEARSGVRAGEVVIVLAPNDPADAIETCKRVAKILFNASPGVVVKVFAADEPETPKYALPA